MAYADQDMSSSKTTAFIITAALHLLVGYALVTGLAYSAMKQVIKKVTTIDVKKEEEEKPPPPKPKDLPPPPPIVAPPPKVNVAVTPPQVQTVVTPPPAPPPIVIAPPAPVPPPPPKASMAHGPKPKGQGSWAARIQDNYPSDALRAEKQGRVGVRVTIGPDGKVTSCSVTSSSGTSSLDSAACQGMERYARYEPAVDDDGNPTTGSANTAIVYRLNN